MRSIILAVLSLAAGVVLAVAIPGFSSGIQRTLGFGGAASPSAREVPPHPEPTGEGAPRAVAMTPELIAQQGIGVAKIGGGTLWRHILVPGTVTIDADRLARVPARVVGTVAELRKRLGDAVEKGEVVAILDSREIADAKSEYLTAQVQAELQRTNFERQQRLVGSQAVSVAVFDQVRASFAEATLRVDLARQKLSALGLDAGEVAAAAKRDEGTPTRSSLRLFPLRAPLTGRVIERKVDVGTRVGSEGDPSDLYTVADLAAVWVELAVPPTSLGPVREGARVSVIPGQDAGMERASGEVIFIGPTLNADTRSARVIVALPNPDGRWRPGAFVSAEVEIARDGVGVLVPRAAVQTIGGEQVVFVRTPDGFARRDVQVGRGDDDNLEITDGLAAGDEIAVVNTFLLKAELGKADAGHDD